MSNIKPFSFLTPKNTKIGVFDLLNIYEPNDRNTIDVINENIYLNDVTYPLIVKDNSSEILAEFLYLGNFIFLGLISTNLVQYLLKYMNSYKILIKRNIMANILDIKVFPSIINNNYNLISIITSKFNYKIAQCDIIEKNEIIELEQINKTCLLFSKYNSLFKSNIKIINNIFIITNNIENKQLYQSSPIITDNKVIGLFIDIFNDNLCFLRISKYLDWISNFDTNNRSLSKITDYNHINLTNNELYNIISLITKDQKLLKKQFDELELKDNKSINDLTNSLNILKTSVDNNYTIFNSRLSNIDEKLQKNMLVNLNIAKIDETVLTLTNKVINLEKQLNEMIIDKTNMSSNLTTIHDTLVILTNKINNFEKKTLNKEADLLKFNNEILKINNEINTISKVKNENSDELFLNETQFQIEKRIDKLENEIIKSKSINNSIKSLNNDIISLRQSINYNIETLNKKLLNFNQPNIVNIKDNDTLVKDKKEEIIKIHNLFA